eukprot:Pgem_evm1s15262
MEVLVIGIHAVLSVIVWSLTVASLASTSWIVIEAMDARLGLFRACEGDICEDFTQPFGAGKATIAFLILANLFIFFALVCSAVAFLQKSKVISFISSGLHSFVFIFLIITVAAWTKWFDDEYKLPDSKYGSGYHVAIAACVLSLPNIMSSAAVCK